MASPDPRTDPLADWDFDLPQDRIARHPTDRRDHSRLLHVRPDGFDHHRFDALPTILRPGDLLVANDTRVMAARLRGARQSGARLEVLVLGAGPGPVPCMIRNARRLKDGERITLGGGPATVLGRLEDGLFSVDIPDLAARMEATGELPLPPYLERSEEPADRERYQTIFAGPLGAAAAPTAGLHFTRSLIETLHTAGIGLATVTLHVGIGTFRPLRDEDLERGELHEERWTVPDATATAIAETRSRGGRIIAIGTTSARTLESAYAEGAVRAGTGVTRLFLKPGSPIRAFDGLITNFHLPRSSLLMLVATLTGRERLLEAYALAIRERYRFYSYGDAMLVL